MQQRSRVGKLIVIALSCVVAFGTTMALVLPGITLEKPACELAEHTHTEACYTQTAPAATRTLSCAAQAHVHTEECYDADGVLVCGMANYLIHTHNSDCYDAAGALVCPLEEHTGTPHVHGETCYTTQQTLVCELEESDEHTHTASCYDQTRTLTCTEPAVSEHVHDENCFVTDQAEAELTCGLEEDEDHTHTPMCYGTWELTCEIPEHTHTEECNLPAELSEEEQAQVEYVVAMIDALPTQGEIEETQAAFDEAEDEDGYDAYLAGVVAQARAAYEAYCALTEAQQAKVTNADRLMALEPLWSAQTLASSPLTDDSAYVSGITVTGITDGTAPWDTEEKAGNDSGAGNKIVRTFDTVTYKFLVQMASYDPAVSYSEARVKLEFVLPLTEDQATFDQGAMAWMDQTENYKPVLTTEERNGVTCQVLTCYRQLLPSDGNVSVVPGNFEQNVVVNVKSMKNGDTFAPIFSAAMEYNTWEGNCEKHRQPEKVTKVADEVRVTAAPKYNIQIGGGASYKSTFDFNTGNESAKAYGDGYGNKQMQGRVMKLGIVIQLYNDNASKGFKGIELPTGDITFDLNVSSKYEINIPNAGSNYQQGQMIENMGSKGYLPLLWSIDRNEYTSSGWTNSDGRVLRDSHGYAQANAPTSYSKSGDYRETACYDGGNWYAIQEGGVIHVTVKNYEIDVNRMPLHNGDGSNNYGKERGIGCFSAGEVWIVQPFNTVDNGAYAGPDYDVVKEYGAGVFHLAVDVTNMKATTISGAQFSDPDGTNHAQIKQDDDNESAVMALLLPGSMINRVSYVSCENADVGVGVTTVYDSRDFATPGTRLRLLGGFSYNHRNEEGNIFYYGTSLTKFYASAIELTDGSTGEVGLSYETRGGGNLSKGSVSVLYATKPDGTDWVSDDELQHTYEEDLVFYKSLAEIPQGKKCVGLLYCFKGPDDAMGADPYYYGIHTAKVRDDMNLCGQTFMLASTSRVWTKSMFEQAGKTLEDIPDWTTQGTRLSDFPAGHYKSGNVDGPGQVYYKKATYAADGSGITYGGNCSWREWGDTLLIIGYKTEITKKKAQMSEKDVEKIVYDLDNEQRVVDFVLQPSTMFDHTESGSTGEAVKTTVTIVDTLPKYLTYHSGSSCFGGTYTQTSDKGGTQGDVEGGRLREPDSVVDNNDGTQTLTWIIPDVTVGEEMEPIYYSADIGSSNPDEDVPVGPAISLVNKVRITATHDLREPNKDNRNYAEAGISVVRGAASSYGKYSKQKVVESDGEIDYVLYYDNNAADVAIKPVLVDAMPVTGTLNNSFSGTWKITSFQISLTETESTLASLQAGLTYTTNAKYAGKDLKYLQDNNGTAAAADWTTVTIGPDGTVSDLIGKMPVMWVLNCESLPGNSELRVEYTIALIPDEGQMPDNIKYVNQFSTGTTTTTTETPAVRRTLEGLTWLDDNTNGIQDEAAERRISGVKVTLLKLNETTGEYEAYHYQGDSSKPVVSVETGKQISVRAAGPEAATDYAADPDESLGRYKFTDLPAGTFAVRFEDGSTEIADLIASPVRHGTDDTRDSDGVPTYSSDHATLQQTMIRDIKMPAAEDMSQVLFESKYHDSGFYEKGPELPMTGGMGTGVFCALGAGLLALGLTGALARRRKHGAKRR